MSSDPAVDARRSELVRLRRVRDRIDREYAQPLDVDALARGANLSAGHLSRQFRAAYGESPYLSDAERETILDLIAKGSYFGVNLATEDLDAAFEKVEASGAEVAQEPMDQPYGVRDCAFRDPAGNMIRMQEIPRTP